MRRSDRYVDCSTGSACDGAFLDRTDGSGPLPGPSVAFLKESHHDDDTTIDGRD
jgi:hypothetical protein